MVVEQRVAHFKAIEGLEADGFVTLLEAQRLKYLNEAFGLGLLFDTGRLNQKHEGPRTSVHYRHLRGTHIDECVVDAKPRKRRHQMFNCRYSHPVLDKGGRQRGFTHVGRSGFNLNDGI